MSKALDEKVKRLEHENAALRVSLAERDRALAEALDQQTATAEVLQVINSSPGELAPVFAVEFVIKRVDFDRLKEQLQRLPAGSG